MITPITQARRVENGSILTMALERDAARYELRIARANFYRLLFVAAAGWLLFTVMIFAYSLQVSSSRLTRDSLGAVHRAPPPIFERSR